MPLAVAISKATNIIKATMPVISTASIVLKNYAPAVFPLFDFIFNFCDQTPFFAINILKR